MTYIFVICGAVSFSMTHIYIMSGAASFSMTSQRHNGDHLRRKKPKCEFLARESVNSSPNFSATIVTSLPFFSLPLCLSRSQRAHLTRNIPSASALGIIHCIYSLLPLIGYGTMYSTYTIYTASSLFSSKSLADTRRL